MTDTPAAHAILRPVPGNDRSGAPIAKARSKASVRRLLIKAAFLTVVAIPLLLASLYLFVVAQDQYASKTGFVVRKSSEKSLASAAELLGGLTSITQASSTESTILYEFIRSQRMVELVDKELDLRTMYSRPTFDPVFAFDPQGSIEALENYWGRMVQPHFDSSSGLLELRVFAFDPDDARRIAEEIIRQCSIKINDLSAVARADRTRYASDDLTKAVDNLKSARRAMTEFRSRNRIVDPKADVQVQMGLISTLQTQLADAMIELDMLNLTTKEADSRINQVQQRISVIQSRIDAERGQMVFGSGEGSNDETFSQLLEEFESLTVDQEFAERAYLVALATYDEALSEASRQSLYLATYIEPTLAETSEYPRRLTILTLMGMFLGLIWAIGSLIAYSVWDRR